MSPSGRRGLVPLAAAVIALSASAAAANAATTPAVAASAKHAHAADGRLLPSVALPVNFASEGIAKGEGSTFYAASLATGDVCAGPPDHPSAHPLHRRLAPPATPAKPSR